MNLQPHHVLLIIAAVVVLAVASVLLVRRLISPLDPGVLRSEGIAAAREHRAAAARWKKRNDEVLAENRCRCGAPGVVTVVAPYPAIGGVPVWRRCAKHADVPLTEPWMGGRPASELRGEAGPA